MLAIDISFLPHGPLDRAAVTSDFPHREQGGEQEKEGSTTVFLEIKFASDTLSLLPYFVW